MNKKHGIVALSLLFMLVTVTTMGIVTYYFQSRSIPSVRIVAESNQIIITDPPPSGQPNLQLQTFRVITTTPAPTITNSIVLLKSTQPTITPAAAGAVVTPAIGGPNPPSGYYCIDDVDPDMCDDNSSHLVPKGTGGITGSCGTVIEQVHKLVPALPQYMKGLRNSLSQNITNCSYSTGTHPAPDYISTFFVIDAYNLAGFHELSKTDPSNVSPSGLFNWWQSAPAGYEYVPYAPTVVQQYASGQKDLTGCVMFLKLGSGSYHIGIVNELELYSTNGDGVLSILQSGTSMYIDRFPVAGWNIENTSTNQTNTNGVAGFGCHT